MPPELIPALMHLKISIEAQALLVLCQREEKEGAWFTSSSPISAFAAQSPCLKCLAPPHYSHTTDVPLPASWPATGRVVTQGPRQHHRDLHRAVHTQIQRQHQAEAGFAIITYHPMILMVVGCTKLSALLAKTPKSPTQELQYRSIQFLHSF